MEDREAERQRAKARHRSKRRTDSKWWDIAPRGFEHISPLQYKAMQGEESTVCACLSSTRMTIFLKKKGYFCHFSVCMYVYMC